MSVDAAPADTEQGLPLRRLGSNGLPVTTVGFGTWAVGGPYLFGWGPVDDEESTAAIREAVESGVNWIDTAPIYGLGHSEEVVARALEPWTVGEEVFVFTKCGRPWKEERGEIGFDLRPASIRDECDASLKRLGVETIDLYQIHWPDTETGTPIEDSWGTMVELKEAGKVRWLGVSNFDVELLDRCEAVHHIDSVQPPLSLIKRSARDDVIPWSNANGAGVIAYAPMANGLLSGKFDRASIDKLAPDDWRRRSAHFTEPKLSQNLELVERLRSIAQRLGATVPALAVAWTLHVAGVTCTAVGARRPDQVGGWIPAATLALGADVLSEIDLAIDEIGAGG
jgi:aryl-alcohol dehydrogenase-like predicted oxidoreductase